MASNSSDQLPLDAGAKEGSLSEGTSSDHTTIVGSCTERFDCPTFPRYSTVSTPHGVPQIYCRSLLSSGNGFGPSNITGAVDRPFDHLYDGANVGDVGYVDEYGAFVYCFNILYDRADPIQPEDAPAGFIPLGLPLGMDDVKFIPDYHPPGTVVASEGVHVSCVSESPLRLDISSTAREGAVLVLPAGASREDLVDPSKFYHYVKGQAARWYHDLNGKPNAEKRTLIPNGTLHLVTGVDRASSWATATFPYRRVGALSRLDFQYDEACDPTWKNAVGLTTIYRHHKESSKDGTVGAVFLRFLSIAVNANGQGLVASPSTTTHERPMHVLPSFELQESGLGILSCFRRKIKQISPCPHEIVFNPSTILLQILLRIDPSAEVALIPDTVWLSQLSDQRHINHAEMLRLMQRIARTHSVANRDGIVTLALRTSTRDHKPSFWKKLLFFTPCISGDIPDESFDTDNKFVDEMYRMIGR